MKYTSAAGATTYEYYAISGLNGDVILKSMCYKYCVPITHQVDSAPGHIVLLVDVSKSISLANAESSVRNACKAVETYFSGNTTTHLSIITFGGPLQNEGVGKTTDASIKLNYEFTGSGHSTAIYNIIDGITDFNNSTNWEAGLTTVKNLFLAPNVSHKPDIVLFITDGNPTAALGFNFSSSNSNNYDADFFTYKAAKVANELKAQGIRIMTLLVGSDINETNITTAIACSPSAVSPYIFNNNLSQYRISSVADLPDGISSGTPAEAAYLPVKNIDYFLSGYTTSVLTSAIEAALQANYNN